MLKTFMSQIFPLFSLTVFTAPLDVLLYHSLPCFSCQQDIISEQRLGSVFLQSLFRKLVSSLSYNYEVGTDSKPYASYWWMHIL